MLAHTARDLLEFDAGELDFLRAHHALEGLGPFGYVAQCKYADAVDVGNTELAINLAQQMVIQFFFQTAHGPGLFRG